ncbi:MAG: GGDEF domain-containing protein [Eubacterium sp.]|nr:GGDEF domain-containing protein [Eubacterium sp.]
MSTKIGKSKSSLLLHKIIIVVLAFIYVVATFFNYEIIYNIISPFLTLAITILLFRTVGNMGKYHNVGICFMISLFSWFLGDLAWDIYKYILPKVEIFGKMAENFYLLTDLIIVGGLLMYARDTFKKSDYHLMFVNIFILSVISVIFGYGTADYYHQFEEGFNLEVLQLILYFFASMFLIITEIAILVRTGFRGHNKAFYTVFFTVMIYCLFEIRYTIMIIINKDPENAYIDIVYMICFILIAFSFTRDDIKDADIKLKEGNSIRNRYLCWINAIVILIITIVFQRVGYLNYVLAVGMVISMLAYLIMYKTVQANSLAEELLIIQKNETTRLEKMVEEKTKELREMNKYLEHISSTDALTGLYNRRYGMDYLARLVKDGSTYPIALYSLDLNFFKPINDNYGHDMGDVVLKEVGKRLNNLKDKRCTAIRIGGDEFIVIFANATNDLAVNGMGDLICKEMDRPIDAVLVTEEFGERRETFQISTSIGIARIPNDTLDIDELLKMADDALYTIKHTHEASAYLEYRNIKEFLRERARKKKEEKKEKETETNTDNKSEIKADTNTDKKTG